MPVITQIAALPWRRDAAGDLQVLLVTSRTNRRWMLPKGWPMSGKSEAEAARVEALEEAGVQGIVDRDPIGSYGYVKDRGQHTARGARARVYALEVTDQLDQWDEMHQRDRRWMSPSDGALLVSEPDLSRFLLEVASCDGAKAPQKRDQPVPPIVASG